uniref:Spindle and kinetochore associated complex subunit 2 n=1 Tax=Chelonoidis abingdonii TaxID=106734 RepID=A0A8C0GRM1_CHEAB
MGELMGFLFQKAESDLDYIQHKLEFEILKNLPDNPSAELSPLSEEEQTAAQQLACKTVKITDPPLEEVIMALHA